MAQAIQAIRAYYSAPWHCEASFRVPSPVGLARREAEPQLLALILISAACCYFCFYFYLVRFLSPTLALNHITTARLL